MSAPLVTQVDLIRVEVRRVSRLTEDLLSAVSDLSDLWEHETVLEHFRVALRAQEAATDMITAVVRLEEATR